MDGGLGVNGDDSTILLLLFLTIVLLCLIPLLFVEFLVVLLLREFEIERGVERGVSLIEGVRLPVVIEGKSSSRRTLFVGLYGKPVLVYVVCLCPPKWFREPFQLHDFKEHFTCLFPILSSNALCFL